MFYNLHRAYACSRKYIQKMCNIFQIAENEMLWVGNILAEYMNIESAASTHIQCNIYIYILPRYALRPPQLHPIRKMQSFKLMRNFLQYKEKMRTNIALYSSEISKALHSLDCDKYSFELLLLLLLFREMHAVYKITIGWPIHYCAADTMAWCNFSLQCGFFSPQWCGFAWIAG